MPRSCGDGFVCDSGLGVEADRVVVGNGSLLSILNGANGAVLSTTDVSNGDFDSNGGGTGIDGNGAAWYSFKFTRTLPVPPSTANPVPTPKVTGNGHSTALITGGRVFVTGVNQGIHAFNVTSGAKADFAPCPRPAPEPGHRRHAAVRRDVRERRAEAHRLQPVERFGRGPGTARSRRRWWSTAW